MLDERTVKVFLQAAQALLVELRHEQDRAGSFSDGERRALQAVHYEVAQLVLRSEEMQRRRREIQQQLDALRRASEQGERTWTERIDRPLGELSAALEQSMGARRPHG